jgi:hypothetical protein
LSFPGGQRDGRSARPRISADAVRSRAEQLASSGMPMQMAMAVAGGKLSLNEALERLSRRDAVEKLVERYSLSRALAMQVVLGHASLESILQKRRFEAHREQHREHSVLDAAAANGEPITLVLHSRRRITGRVLLCDAYLVRFQRDESSEAESAGAPRPEEIPAEDLHKLQIKYAYSPDDAKRVRKVLRVDRSTEAVPAEPIPRPQDRYACSDWRLFQYVDTGHEVQVTTLEGDQLRGHVEWFGRFEFGIRVKGGAAVTVFRHALFDLRLV